MGSITFSRIAGLLGISVFVSALIVISTPAQAVPSFARQTGQNCVSCHAGGQFPELTPYGRLFKLTGYTLGSRAIPISAMAVGSYSKTRNTTGQDTADFPKDGSVVFEGGSLFLAGKITDNLGLFLQWTYDNYAAQNDEGRFLGHSSLDNTELRYADRFIDASHDLIVGTFANNNPSLQDVWNSTPAWGYPFLSSPFAQSPSAAPLITGLGGTAGAGAYAYWNKFIYGELSLYRTANGVWSALSKGTADADTVKLKGANPYWRLALTKEWGAHNAMIGAFGMIAKVFPDNLDPTGPTSKFRDYGFDAQYQYILDPHTITAQASYIREKAIWADVVGASNPSDKLTQLKLKGTYVFRAKYGATLAYVDTRGDTDANLFQDSAPDPANGVDPTPLGNVSGNPGSTVWIPEVFWTPIQYLRVGVQYSHYTKFNGARTNYDGAGRNAKDNDTLYLYLWGAY